MTVRVLFFAYLRERVGMRELAMQQPNGARVEDLWQDLCRRFPELAGTPLRFALNSVYVDKSHPLQEDDELALIPPVSGGT